MGNACRLAALLLIVTPELLHARVYWRQPVDVPGSWAKAYESPIRLQRGEGDLHVFVTGDRLSSVEVHLRKLHGDELTWFSGEVMAWGMAIEDGMLYRYLVQPRPPEDGGYWVVALSQKMGEAGKPGQEPARHQLTELPRLPNSRPTFYSLAEDTKMQVEVSSTPSSPAAALDQLTQMLTSDGWQASPANTGGFRMFVRRDQVALLGANRGKDGQTRVLRLHKPLGVK